MVTIRLEDITVRFSRGAPPVVRTGGLVRHSLTRYRDRAFVDRMVARADALPARRGTITALDRVNLIIENGTTLSVIGPSGCGKSTLLRVIAGLEPPDEGRVLYDDRDMASVTPGERGIGMVFQSYALYPHLEGEGNLAFTFRIRKRPPAEMMERIRETSEIMGLGFDDLLPRRPRTLSGGQQQRVAIARCIVRNPALFLFDEPLSNLDAELRARTRVEIKRLLQRFAITSVYVTHDQMEAVALGDRLAVMNEGRIVQVGTYRELMHRPANAFVAGFVGHPPMNIVHGYRACAGPVLKGPAGPLALPPSSSTGLGSNQEYIIGFRPSAARWQATHGLTAGAGLVLRGTVRTREPDLARREQTVYLELGDLLLGMLAPGEVSFPIGQTVEASIPLSDIYLFEASSGRRLLPA
ncbi:MAG: ABC transporter ATP-binding protein [Chloroflexi bacterium]|nr:ABC transporter ATP-binding protein [Chloroflexota bacterium]